jgi:peptide chain release factor 1
MQKHSSLYRANYPIWIRWSKRLHAVRLIEKDIAGLDELMADGSSDSEMRGLAEEERREALIRQTEAEHTLRLMLLPKDAADERGAITRSSRGYRRR